MITIAPGRILTFVKFFLTHGHARNIPEFDNHKPPLMETAVKHTARFAQHELWMPNTDMPGAILTANDVCDYRLALREIAPDMRHSIALKLTPESTREILTNAIDVRIRRVKIYPPQVTTNSDSNFDPLWLDKLMPAIEVAVELGLVICIHCEQPGSTIDTYDREKVFIQSSLAVLVDRFPGARINVEHISTKVMFDYVLAQGPNVTGGLTLHHLILSRNDVLEGGSNFTHHHCRPPAHRFENRDVLLDVALNAHLPEYRRFHFGPDSAPHTKRRKETCGCAGVFTAPVLGPATVTLFEKHDRLFTTAGDYHPAFLAFTYENGASNFGIEDDLKQTFKLKKEEWKVPMTVGGVQPFLAGEILPWKWVES